MSTLFGIVLLVLAGLVALVGIAVLVIAIKLKRK